MNALDLSRAVGCSPAVAALWADPILSAMTEYGIMSRLRAAMFLAQIGHETGSLRNIAEIWGPTPAQTRYEGRVDLGNTQPGDGRRFAGHGLIQVTGRANHAAARDRLRARLGSRVPNFEVQPLALCSPQWAAYSAGDYWDSRGLNAIADRGDVELVTRRINGGLNGIDDRRARYVRALEVLA